MNPLFPDLDLSSTPTFTPSVGPPKKLLKHLSGDDYILEIDNTSLESFLACDRASFYRLIQSRTTYPSAAIVYGQAVHRGLEALYLGHSRTRSNIEAQKVLAKHPLGEHEWRNSESLEKALRGYHKQYFPEPFEIVSDKDGLCVERPFSIHLGEIDINCQLAFDETVLVSHVVPSVIKRTSSALYIRKLHIVWTGVIDLIVRQNDSLWIMDHKTSSVIGPSYFEGFNLSQQFIGYAFAASSITGENVAGAILNVIAGRKPTKSGVSLEFHRRHYLYPQWQLDEWKNDILALVSDFVERLQTGYFPKKTLWCVGKFGTCPYMSVCQTPPENRPFMLFSDAFDNNTWNPLDKIDSKIIDEPEPLTTLPLSASTLDLASL